MQNSLLAFCKSMSSSKQFQCCNSSVSKISHQECKAPHTANIGSNRTIHSQSYESQIWWQMVTGSRWLWWVQKIETGSNLQKNVFHPPPWPWMGGSLPFIVKIQAWHWVIETPRMFHHFVIPLQVSMKVLCIPQINLIKHPNNLKHGKKSSRWKELENSLWYKKTKFMAMQWLRGRD